MDTVGNFRVVIAAVSYAHSATTAALAARSTGGHPAPSQPSGSAHELNTRTFG
jgi:hypothetical protein